MLAVQGRAPPPHIIAKTVQLGSGFRVLDFFGELRKP